MSRSDLRAQHGGPDGGPPILWDFSSNANAVPTAPHVLAALVQADRQRYPDPHYTALREHLAQHAKVLPEHIVPTAGSSEGIRRLTLAAHLGGVQHVGVPQPGYGDYAAAAQAIGMSVSPLSDPHAHLDWIESLSPGTPALLWLCEPCNPTGRSAPESFWRDLHALMAQRPRLTVALDRAYEPLRLRGHDPVPPAVAAACWQLWSPNKALGLTGVRAGWMQAPAESLATETQAAISAEQLLKLAPSWVLSAEGLALLMTWHEPATQAWLLDARQTLSAWMTQQQAALQDLGWQHEPSDTPFFVSRPPRLSGPSEVQDTTALLQHLQHLRDHGIKLRDATSFALPGLLRLRTHCPQAQAALLHCLHAWHGPHSSARTSA